MGHGKMAVFSLQPMAQFIDEADCKKYAYGPGEKRSAGDIMPLIEITAEIKHAQGFYYA